jgi:hypothetical protein
MESLLNLLEYAKGDISKAKSKIVEYTDADLEPLKKEDSDTLMEK